MNWLEKVDIAIVVMCGIGAIGLLFTVVWTWVTNREPKRKSGLLNLRGPR